MREAGFSDMRKHRTRRVGLGAGLVALAACVLFAGAGPAAAATVDALGYAYFYWQQDGTSTWHTEKIPGSGSATPYTSASIAVT